MPWGMVRALAFSVVASAIFALGTGFFALRADAVGLGVIVDWRGEVEQITVARSPVLQHLAIVCLSALIVLPYVGAVSYRRPSRELTIGSSTVALLLAALSAWALFNTRYPYSTVQGNVGGARTLGGEPDGPEALLLVWLSESGLSAATHAVVGVMVVLALVAGRRWRVMSGDRYSRRIDHEAQIRASKG